jgi:hypothetical protein
MADTAVVVGATPADKHSFALLLGARDVVRNTAGKSADVVMTAARKLHVTGALKAAGRTLGWLVGRAEWIISAVAGLGLAPLAALAVSTKLGRRMIEWSANTVSAIGAVAVYLPANLLSKLGAPGRFLAACLVVPYEKVSLPVQDKIAQGYGWLCRKAPTNGKPMQTVALLAKASIVINLAAKFLPSPWNLAVDILIVPMLVGSAYRQPVVYADPMDVARLREAGNATAEPTVPVKVKTIQTLHESASRLSEKVDAAITAAEERATEQAAVAKAETAAEAARREIEADAEKTAGLQYALDVHEAQERERLSEQKAEAERVLETLTTPPGRKLSARDLEVERIMKEKGLSKTQAKAYVRQNGITEPVPA